MTLDTFFEKFELLADAPDAVGRMRELVLELATQGKLVERIRSEGTGFEILEQLGVECFVPDEAPNVPDHWVWSCLENINAGMNSGWSPACLSEPANEGEWGVLKTTAVQPLEYRERENKKLPQNLAPRPENEVQEGDILFTRAGPMNRVGILCVARPTRQQLMISDKIIRFHLLPGIDPDFAALAMNTGHSGRVIEGLKSGMAASQVNISQPKLRSVPIPLPPLAEQKRIVAKVEELMALCDRLEAQQQERATRHAALARASLSRFAEAPTPAHLNLLFHPSYDIPPAELRKAILTLAVQGKLVEQDAADESAHELLARVARGRLSKLGGRGDSPRKSVVSDEVPYKIPESWAWASFQDVASIASNLVDPKRFQESLHLAPDNIEKGTGILLPCATVRDDDVKSSNHRFFAGQIVYSKIRPNLAKVVVVDFDGLCSADMYPINALIDPYYLQRYMLSEPFLVQAVKTDTRVAMPKINQMELNAINVPVPPLAEQRRILVKVNELMTLVDALEAQLVASCSTAKNLLEALVAELTQAKAKRLKP